MSNLNRANGNLMANLEERMMYDINMGRNGSDLTSKLNDILVKYTKEFANSAKGSTNLGRLNSLLTKMLAKSFEKINSGEQFCY